MKNPQRQFYSNLKDQFRGIDQKDKLISEAINPGLSSINSYKNSIIQANKGNPIISRARPFLNSKKQQIISNNIYRNTQAGKLEDKGSKRIKSMSTASERNQSLLNASKDLQFLQSCQRPQQNKTKQILNDQKLRKMSLEALQYIHLNQNYQSPQHKNLQNNYRQLMQKCTQLQNINQQRDYIIQQLNSKNSILNGQKMSQSIFIEQLKKNIVFLQNQNKELRQSVLNLQISKKMPSRHKEIQINVKQFEQKVREFEEKVLQMQNQNSGLKNTVGHLQGKVAELGMQKTALQTIVDALQERNSFNKQSVLDQQIISLRNQLQRQKEDKDRLVSKYQLQILKMQNFVQNERYLKTQSLLDFSDQDRLQEKLLMAISELQQFRSKQQLNKT